MSKLVRVGAFNASCSRSMMPASSRVSRPDVLPLDLNKDDAWGLVPWEGDTNDH